MIRSQPESGRSPRRSDGILRPVDYSARRPYRPPPALYRRLQVIALLINRLGLSADYVVTLEVPGRRTGVVRSTSLVQVGIDGQRYLVALSGESEWVRNVHAAQGRAVLGRRTSSSSLAPISCVKSRIA